MKNWFPESTGSIYWHHLLPPVLWAVLMIVIFGLRFDTFPSRLIAGIITPGQLAHISVFAIFTFLLVVGLKKQYNNTSLRNHGVKITIMITVFYGILLEVLQLTVFEGRSFEFLDIILNIFGCLIGILIFYIIYKGAITIS